MEFLIFREFKDYQLFFKILHKQIDFPGSSTIFVQYYLFIF